MMRSVSNVSYDRCALFEDDRVAAISDMCTSMDCIDTARQIITRLLGGGRVLTVEGSCDNVCRILDAKCGIDYLHVCDRTGIVRGIASRVQYTKNYRSFTIRKARASGVETEFEKRKRAIKRGGIYPALTVQVYTDGSQITGLAIAHTSDLIDFIESGHAVERSTGSDRVGQASFYICYWDAMRAAGYKVLEA